MPRPSLSACSAASAAWMLPSGAGSSSVNSAASWATPSGWLDASRAASTIRLMSCWSMRRCLAGWNGGAAWMAAAREASVGGVGGRVVEFAGELQRLVGRARAGQRLEVDRGERGFLDDVEQALLGRFQDRQEGDAGAQAALARLGQGLEPVEGAVLEPGQQFAHALAHAQGVAADGVAGEQFGALE